VSYGAMVAPGEWRALPQGITLGGQHPILDGLIASAFGSP